METRISTFIGFMATFYRLCFNYVVLPFAKAVFVVVLDILLYAIIAQSQLTFRLSSCR